MSESYCDLCGGLVSSHRNVFRLSDDKEWREWSGHGSCVTELEHRVKALDYKKMSVKKILEKLK